ncbi:hypothetical protein ABBQ38_005431 [Trebouxia sp. C0009 RCD-2024]
MATTKKIKLSDEAVAENDSGVFQALEQVQQKLDQITDQRSDEILAVERRYNEIRRPVYLERNKLMREVPDLWLQCMLQHQQIADLVTERDTELLSYLEEIDVEDFPDIKSGYKITFTFKQNPFFKNQALVKELHYADDNALAIKGTDIEWTETGLQHQEQAQEELTNGRKRRAEESTSLFEWFWDSGDLPEGNEPISDLIKDELWTNPMRGSSDGVQDGDGMEGPSEEDGGMYSEEQEIEQYEYTDDPGLQGADDDDAEVDPQESDLQTDLQDEDELAELELTGAPEGDDDVEDQAEAPADYQDEEAEGTALADDVSNLGILSTDGTTLSSAEDAQEAPPGLAPDAEVDKPAAVTDSPVAT